MRRSAIHDSRFTKRAFSLIELLVTITVISILSAALMPALRNAKEAGNSVKCLSNLRQLYLANCLYAENHNGFFVLGSEDILTSNLKRWHGERPNTSTPFDPSKSPLVNYLGVDGKIKICPSLRDAIKSGAAAYEAGSGGYGYNHTYVGGRADAYGFPDSISHSLSLNDNKAWCLSKFVMFGDVAMPTDKGLIEESFLYPPFWQSMPDPNPVTSSEPDPSLHFRHNDRANVIWCDGHATRESMSHTRTDLNSYGGISAAYKVGWFGARTNNAGWKPE